MYKQIKLIKLSTLLLLISGILLGVMTVKSEPHQPNSIHDLPAQIKIGGVFPITGRPEAGPKEQ